MQTVIPQHRQTSAFQCFLMIINFGWLSDIPLELQNIEMLNTPQLWRRPSSKPLRRPIGERFYCITYITVKCIHIQCCIGYACNKHQPYTILFGFDKEYNADFTPIQNTHYIAHTHTRHNTTQSFHGTCFWGFGKVVTTKFYGIRGFQQKCGKLSSLPLPPPPAPLSLCLSISRRRHFSYSPPLCRAVYSRQGKACCCS